MKQMSFIQAMKDYFGVRPNADGTPGTAMTFMNEIKALSDEDRAWFRNELPKVGYEITATVTS